MPEFRFFGYWSPVRDEASARQAVRMAGLPVLVMGWNAALLALVAAVQPAPDVTLLASSAAVACLLILLAFRIRAGHAAWVPVAMILFLAFLAATAGLSVIGGYLADGSGASTLQTLAGWIIPVLCLVLAVGGWRGWRWLRQHGRALSF